jgi:hypothetical protein
LNFKGQNDSKNLLNFNGLNTRAEGCRVFGTNLLTVPKGYPNRNAARGDGAPYAIFAAPTGETWVRT